jgi:hypothetical protein
MRRLAGRLRIFFSRIWNNLRCSLLKSGTKEEE